MSVFLACTILLLISQNKCASADSNLRGSIQKELQARNISCELHLCSDERLNSNSCQCGEICAQYGTCCIDSDYSTLTPPRFRPTCRSLDRERSYYMIDHCPPDSPWKILCEEELNADNDVMKLIPVTSLFTLITYKNYFCFRCHESSEDFRFWQVELGSYDDELDESIGKNEPVSLTYDHYNKTWLSPVGPGGSLIELDLNIEVPHEINSLPVSCDKELISRCSDAWSDEEVRKRCEAYMGVIYIRRNNTFYQYSNLHCALCNFEEVEKFSCPFFGVFKHGKVPFSFTYLLDVNRSDGNLVGKIQRCKDKEVWDPFTKECRGLSCALDGYVVKNGKCVAP